LDVWFDSGVSYATVLENRNKGKIPADLYLEGSDQHRGWFHTSLLTAIGTRGKAPYKRVLTHGFVVDSEGKKLSKSAKNYLPPDNVLKKYGAEMLRLWVSTEDFRSDIRFSETLLEQLSDSYRKIRNTCRYLLGNLNDFKPGKDDVPYKKLPELDRWALHLLHQLIQETQEGYETYSFHKVTQGVLRFCSVDMSAIYLDILKDRLYTEKKDGILRRSAQTVLFQILDSLVRLISPILSFTAEDIWQVAPDYKGKTASVFLAGLPEAKEEWDNPALAERWDRFLNMRDVVMKALENARAAKFIGNSLAAAVVLDISGDQNKFLESFGDDLPNLFIVSQVKFGEAQGEWVYESPALAGFKVGVEKAAGIKCERCWKFDEYVGKDKTHPTLCKRCVGVIA
ncbi:MAG: class I tRNA ligase family protein, partial [Deltaproteobacteria bacterium]|nr:class I tRNA ligase family protein [Deltaproteobacteria bacterium]